MTSGNGGAVKNILLVSPYAKNEMLWVTGEEASLCEVLNIYPPLGLATVAGLTPEDGFHVQLWDEVVHGVIDEKTVFDREYHLVGVTGYGMHRPRAIELAQIFRKRGVLTCAGGPGASSAPKEYQAHFDVVFAGEVEVSWPQFLRDWQEGKAQPVYHQIDKPELDTSPLPRWDSIRSTMKHYHLGAVQTTRGCPYDCEFCDVIYLFGRRQRHKPVKTVIEEVKTMADFGYEWIFFCDDEFGGDRKYAKELLRALIAFNETLERPMYYSTQMCITASGDKEFCELLAAANFDMVFIGIESANPGSLKGANKLQNLRGNLLDNIHTLLRYGIGIRSGMIVGFDEDDTSIFQTTYDFLQKACLPSIGIYMLMAPLGTRLWMRLMHEGRVVSLARNRNLGPARARTNIIPKSMTRLDLLRGYRWLLDHVYSWDAYAERICGFLSLAGQSPHRADKPIPKPDAKALVEKLGAVPEALPAAAKILDHAEQVAPHLMRRAKDLVVQFARYHVTIQETLRDLDVNIAREEAGEMILDRNIPIAPLPLTFKNELNRILPEVYRRLYANLQDRSRISLALTDVFVELLLRVGSSFEKFEQHHLTLLEELCDRHAAKYNGIPAVDFLPLSPEAELAAAQGMPNIKKLRVVDDIYKSVFQRIAEHGRPAPPPVAAAQGSPAPA